MAVRNEAAEQIDEEIAHTTVARVFDLRNVFELIDDSFGDVAFTQ